MVPANPLTPELERHLADSYPHNHDYRVRGGRLRPGWQLWRRWRRIRRHYTLDAGTDGKRCLESLLDLSSCKGFFVLDAAKRLAARRALGIDVHEFDIQASRAAASKLGLCNAHFERLYLHEVAESSRAPFQTALLINTYPYLYFGSQRDPHRYGDHELIFGLIAKLVATGGRLIFSNRLELERCPAHIQELARETGLASGYDEAKIRTAAARHFHIESHGSLGRIPLLVMKRR